jgi:hypothetical protein
LALRAQRWPSSARVPCTKARGREATPGGQNSLATPLADHPRKFVSIFHAYDKDSLDRVADRQL